MAFYRNPSQDQHLSAAERAFIESGGARPENARSESKGAPLLYLARQKKVIGVSIGFASYNYTFYLLLTWLPSFLGSSMHLDPWHSALYTGIPWLFAFCVEMLLGGWLVDALIQSGRNAIRVRQAVLIGGTTLGLGILGAAFSTTAVWSLFWISVSIGGLAAAASVGWSIPGLIAPRDSVGSVGGIMNFITQISAISAPVDHRICGEPNPLFRLGLWRSSDLSGDRRGELHSPAGQHRAGSPSRCPKSYKKRICKTSSTEYFWGLR